MTELKPCPFCGDKLKIIESTHFRFGRDIICTNEWTEGEDKHETSCPMGGHSFLCSDAELIKKANFRPLESALEAQVADMHSRLKEVVGNIETTVHNEESDWNAPSFKERRDGRINGLKMALNIFLVAFPELEKKK